MLSLLFAFSAVMKLTQKDLMAKEFVERLGYPQSAVIPIGILELACVALFVVPRTSVLGAVLLTGYLGGAITTHVRIDDPFWSPAAIGVAVWLCMYLRDPRIRDLLPLRSKASPA
ncbi:MAG: DoxX family protein [Phycisphaerae bacterium]|nr:DoxX family protein [Phycisphaerae bacterium]